MWIKCNFHWMQFSLYKMRYSIEPRERRNVKGYGFLSFARNIGTHATKVAKTYPKERQKKDNKLMMN